MMESSGGDALTVRLRGLGVSMLVLASVMMLEGATSAELTLSQCNISVTLCDGAVVVTLSSPLIMGPLSITNIAGPSAGGPGTM
jgi:hypothetical protein